MCYITNTIEVEGRVKDVVTSAEVDLQVGAVVVVDGHAHLQHLAMMMLKMTMILTMMMLIYGTCVSYSFRLGSTKTGS